MSGEFVVYLENGKYHRALVSGSERITPDYCPASGEGLPVFGGLPVFATPSEKCRVCYPADVSPLRDFSGEPV